MLCVHVTLLAALVYSVSSLPFSDEDEVKRFLPGFRHVDAPWLNPAGEPLEDTLRRQLGDLEFSNRYAEFLQSRAKHSCICSFLQRLQGFKKSGAEGHTEKVNLLLKQYMCPSGWPSDL